MSLHKLTAGDGYTYLTRQVAAHDATHRGFEGLGEYYAQRGESPGVWLGRGLTGLPGVADGPVSEAQMRALFGQGRHPDAEAIGAAMLAAGHAPGSEEVEAATRLGRPFPIADGATVYRARVAQAFADHNAAVGLPGDWPVPAGQRAAIRTRVVDEMFVQEYGRAPLDVRERSGFLARVSRQATTAVAGYDLTFSPVKSVSALWAIAPAAVAAQVEAAHQAAVADVIAWLEDTAVYTRLGTNGVAQVDVTGLVAAAFTHRDSRAGDPDLHTHVAVSNKVQALTGRWLALDGRPLHKAVVAASERYNTRLEAQLVARLGVQFANRPGTTPGQRPVREIVGVDPRLLAAWSRRRAAIDVHRGKLATAFQSDHGRPPTAVEAIHLAQQATLATRAAKHEPRSHAEQRATWRAEAATVLGGERAVTDLVNRSLHPTRRDRVHTASSGVTRGWVEATAVDVVVVVSASRATWQECHVRAETERRARTAKLPLRDLDAAVNAVVGHALSAEVSVRLGAEDPVTRALGEPPVLRRRDGASVYSTAGTQLYTSAAVLAAEQRLLAHGDRLDARVIDPQLVDVALLEAAANGTTLNASQARLVHDLAGSRRRLQVALAPAGTGKTTALAVLARAWTAGGGSILGLAPSAAAAAVLREELDAPTETLAKLTHTLDTHALDRKRTDGGLPAWVTAIGPDTLVVVDEAGMASTLDLARTVDHAVARGARVALIGDDRQLAAVGAGGILRDLAHTYGALTLGDVVRFSDPAEGPASLALREGDPAGIAYYTDHARLHVGDLATVTDHAYTAWATDIAAGRNAVMLAPTRDLAAALNARAQTERLRPGRSRLTGDDPATGDTRRGDGVTGDDAGCDGVDVAGRAGVAGGVVLGDGTRAGVGDTVITRRNDRRLVVSASDWVKNGDRWTVTHVTPDHALAVTHLTSGRRTVLPAAYVAADVALGYATTVHAAQGVTADVAHSVATATVTRQQVYVAMTRGRTANHLYLTTAGDGDPHTVTTRDAILPPTPVDVLTRILARDGSQTSATTHTRDLSDPARRLAAAADAYSHAVTTAAQNVLGDDVLTRLDDVADTLVPGLTGHDGWPLLRGLLALHAAHGRDPATQLRATCAGRGLGDARDPAAVLAWRLPAVPEATRGPLPWLPVIPPALAEHPTWGAYLTARAAHISDLADQVGDDAAAWTSATAPAWAVPLIPAGPDLVRDVAVWRAAHAVPNTYVTPTGPAVPDPAAARYQRTLTTVVADHIERATTGQWAAAVAGIDPRILADPYWPTLAAHLATAAKNGTDIGAVLAHADTDRPLPDEQHAAALWWRLTPHLPATVTAGGTAVDEDSGWLSVEQEEIAAQTRAEIAAILARPVPIGSRPARTPVVDPAVARTLELNAYAAAFYATHYPRSWAADHLRERFGADLAADPRFTPGYAPPGWRTLIEHLHTLGATDHDIVTAGLGVYAAGTRRVLDRFRDRLVLPIHTDAGIAGFVARRHPDSGDTAGPKYLNTTDTPAYRKAETLYAPADVRALLDNGAMPVIVEGPLDAIAVTLAGNDDYVPVSPLGTALTPSHARQLRRYFGEGRDRVIVATDNDPAGRAAATRAYQLLTGQGATPRQLLLPEGTDPAAMRHCSGPETLATAMRSAPDMATRLIDQAMALHGQQPDSVEARVHALRQVAPIIAALPPTLWSTHIHTVSARLNLLPLTTYREIAAAQHQGLHSTAVSDPERPLHETAQPARNPVPPIAADVRRVDGRSYGARSVARSPGR